MIAMASIPSVFKKEKNRKPMIWPADTSEDSYKLGARFWDETPKWGDAPSFSFDYYDKEPHSVIGTAPHQQGLETIASSGLKPIRRFFPSSWKNVFRKSRTKEKPFTLKASEGLQCSPPVTPLLDDSRDTSFEDRNDVHTRTLSSLEKNQVIEAKKSPGFLEKKSHHSSNYGEKRIHKPKRIMFEDEVQHLGDMKSKVIKTIHFSEKGSDSGALNYSIPTGHRPKPYVVADYVLKYPEIMNLEEKERYKAVFNDQYAEYKELHREVRAAMLKFKELDAMMIKLKSGPQSQKAPERIKAITEKYEQKKNNPAFKEKQERCRYLKEKLTHIKQQIQAFDQKDGSVYF
ncbi:occludin/ELL domain-containing protein 1 isoform X2 [Bombina bombina]|uniref:occludin/ELL domain-containing protein 1 isoform X2 n=1 Tax=Bombina bombina TaxID=8345 RepID=UPI00235B073E|nr:occludin/ELL domain-containing protein 1 isoform X2 [Bombina bombina]